MGAPHDLNPPEESVKIIQNTSCSLQESSQSVEK